MFLWFSETKNHRINCFLTSIECEYLLKSITESFSPSPYCIRIVSEVGCKQTGCAVAAKNSAWLFFFDLTIFSVLVSKIKIWLEPFANITYMPDASLVSKVSHIPPRMAIRSELIGATTGQANRSESLESSTFLQMVPSLADSA